MEEEEEEEEPSRLSQKDITSKSLDDESENQNHNASRKVPEIKFDQN